ncbi:hypothetical protein C2I36_03280 [Rhodobacteraceae bacterium WD3A24]|nr:hypothetical protein C2I36_03280 [Rhodobacteraceae bacterium WD3A24]
MRIVSLILLAGVAAAPARAEPPVVEDVTLSGQGGEVRVSVTLSHPDTGWDHFADGWELRTPDGTRLGYRELAHPHVNEQPFTRSLRGVEIPDGLTRLHVRAHCNVDGWSSTPYVVELDGGG